MKLSREQMLVEMGITPLWRLRTPAGQAAVPIHGEEPESAPAPAAPPAPEEKPASTPAAKELSLPTRQVSTVTAKSLPSSENAISHLDWEALEARAAACRACVLCEHRKQTVFGVGDRQADWLFIGEGPGAEEDAKGEPFVGQAGKLLDNMLAAIDLKRGDGVYIANAVKCRPPGNRTPVADEMAACRPYLDRQIELIKPRLIVLLGRAAVGSLLKDDHALNALRGKRFEYKGIPVVVTYHPAYLLRNLPEKAKAWEDLVFARRLMRELLGEKGDVQSDALF